MAQKFPVLELPVFEEYYGESHKDSCPIQKGTVYNLSATKKKEKTNFDLTPSRLISWYDKNTIHEKEKIAFPDLLNTKYGVNNYIRWRNSIIELYHSFNGERVSIKEARKVCDCDIVVLMSIVIFLEKEELINYKTDEFCSIAKVKNTETADSESEKNEGMHEKCLCDATENLYISTKNNELVCNKCLDNGIYRKGNMHSDFVVYEKHYTENLWSKKQELQLLDLFDETHDWDYIASQIGKTREQCIIRFLSLDAKEGFVATEHTAYGKNVINSLPNPVMNFIALVCGSVSPKMASIIAKKVLENLEDRNMVNDEVIELCKTHATENRKAEEDRLVKLQRTLVELQKSKLELKISEYEEMLEFVEKERNDNEYARKTCIKEYNDIKRQKS